MTIAEYYADIQRKARAQPHYAELEVKLLALSRGSRVIPRMLGPHLCELLERGAIIRGAVRLQPRGRDNRCHYNAAVRWLRDPAATLCTGYVCGANKVWRQHSWNVRDGEILDWDNNNRAVLYFGVTPADPEKFTLAVVWEEWPMEQPDSAYFEALAHEIGPDAMVRFAQIMMHTVGCD
jgi:hypothetical protein